jgi:signal transduction histidine kinase
MDIDDTIPSHVMGDSHRLRQVLTNLLSNAVKFTHQGSVTLEIRQSYYTADGVCLLFSVTDTGIGIAPKMQQKLFQPFVQEDGSHTRRYGGTGLGLAISLGIVILMGSQITLHSEEGKGSKFMFSVIFAITVRTN